MKKIYGIAMVFILSVVGCRKEPDTAGINTLLNNPLPGLIDKLTEVIITDVFTPPVICRIYAYSTVAAYEAIRHGSKDYPTYAGKLNGLSPVPSPGGKFCDYRLAQVVAFYTVAAKLVFDTSTVKKLERDFLRQMDSLHINETVRDSSVSYGRRVGAHIISWAAKDGYLQRNSFPAYIVTRQPGTWQPTPPNYSDATESNWKTLRPMTLDSVSQFMPSPPVPYDTVKDSPFFKEAYLVFQAVRNPAAGDSAIAWYWDDNPNTSITDGHITYFQQKNSPGGHWMHIAASIAKHEKYSDVECAALLSKTAIAMHDAFISCWYAKYTFNYIRPETFINKYIDRNWVPVIQTPPFPEYLSGHSVCSASAAAVLTRIVGDNYAFIDSAEVPYGRPTRKFSSFFAAADEASISRFYGGIHFMNALTASKVEGRKIGAYVVERLK